MSLIKLTDIEKIYTIADTQRQVLKKINLTIENGEFVSIVGASGSGKSTLMHIIGLLDEPSAGEYEFNHQHFHHLSPDALAAIRNQQIGFVFQFFYLLPRLNAIENIMLPLLYQDMPIKEAKDRAYEWLERLDLSAIAKNKPPQLSGGQQQRVAIARALVTNPKLLLADEPTGALDSQTSKDIMELFLKLHATSDKTIILITHNPQIADQCQREIRIQDGEIVDDRMI